jgi:hypothetical protein
MISVSVEPLAGFLEELKPILARHTAEVDDYLRGNGTMLNPEYDEYLELDAAGVIQCVVARDNKQKIAGYVLYIIADHNHYKGVKFGTCDMIYVSPFHRKTGVAIDMITFAEYNFGCDYMTLADKVGHEFPGLIKAVGYTPLETTYIRKIDHE